MTMNLEANRLNAAIIGAGAVGEYHINAQYRHGSNVIVYEPNEERAAAVSEKFGFVAVAESLDEALERADLVHICSPHKYHADGAIAAIEAGKPVIVEKPLTVDLGEAVQIYKSAKAEDVPVMVGTSYRLTPTFLRAKRGLDEGEIGELISLETTYLHDMSRVKAGADWRQSPDRGSFLYGGGAHAIDLNMWLAGQPVKQVQAIIAGKKVRDSYPGDEDFDLSIQYEDGTNGRVWLSAAAPLPEHGADVKLYGTNGAYQAHNKSPLLKTYIDGASNWITDNIGKRLTIDDMSRNFNAFVTGAAPDFRPMPDIEEGLRVMIVIDALERAALSGSVEKVPSLEEVVNRY